MRPGPFAIYQIAEVLMLETIANVAEIIGVTLVLVTLVFLTLQIRQNTRAIRSTTIQAVMQSDMTFAQILVDNAELWDRVLAGEMPAKGEETRRAIVLFNLFMIDAETRFHQFSNGFLDEQSWESRLDLLPHLVTLPVFALWRKSLGGRSHYRDFLEIVDRVHTETTPK